MQDVGEEDKNVQPCNSALSVRRGIPRSSAQPSSAPSRVARLVEDLANQCGAGLRRGGLGSPPGGRWQLLGGVPGKGTPVLNSDPEP